MLELALLITAGAVAATFLTDATSSALKMARATRRRDNIRVAETY